MKELLYQINECNKTVKFAIVRNDEDTMDALSHNNNIILPFDEIIKKAEELKYYFREYEGTAFKIIEMITRAQKLLVYEINELKRTDIYNKNIFAHYYSNVIIKNAFKARDVINSSILHIFTFNSIVESSKSNIYSTVNSIRDTLFTDWNENDLSENALHCIEFDKKTVLYRDGIHSEIYTVADDSLFNFFFDFNEALLKENKDDEINCCDNTDDYDEGISDCFYVDKSCPDKSQTGDCKQIGCRVVLLLPKKRKKRAPNNRCENPVKTIGVYFRADVLKLKEQFSTVASDELKKQKDPFYDEIKCIVEEYKKNKRSTICPEMEATIDKIENKINIEFTKIKSKYSSNNTMM